MAHLILHSATLWHFSGSLIPDPQVIFTPFQPCQKNKPIFICGKSPVNIFHFKSDIITKKLTDFVNSPLFVLAKMHYTLQLISVKFIKMLRSYKEVYKLRIDNVWTLHIKTVLKRSNLKHSHFLCEVCLSSVKSFCLWLT